MFLLLTRYHYWLDNISIYIYIRAYIYIHSMITVGNFSAVFPLSLQDIG